MMTIEEFQQKYSIVGKAKEIRDLVDITMQVAPSDISVLIYGESGVGKEIFARAIHNYSRRADKQLVTVNCGAIPEGILESELFGHKKGAFTGAIDNRKGYFEIADGGTLFLDEIAEMPLTTQVKLLRVIENKEFMKIGAETVSKIDVRIIAATNKDLQKEVDAKRFRDDLYFRLKAVTFNIPPLRKRKTDIAEFISFFIKNYTKLKNIPVPEIEKDALELLRNYSWPGNVRELKNTIESAIELNRTGKLGVEDFIPFLNQFKKEDLNKNLPMFLKKTPEEVEREFIYRALFELKKDILEVKDLIYSRENELQRRNGNQDEHEVVSLQELEKEAIKNALEHTKGNKRKAAKLLNISERTLYRKIKEFDL